MGNARKRNYLVDTKGREGMKPLCPEKRKCPT
jgi:hypothetical protein